jgi:hypothetical protein
MMEWVRFAEEARKEQFRAGSDLPRYLVPDTITNFMTVPRSRLHGLALVSYTRLELGG